MTFGVGVNFASVQCLNKVKLNRQEQQQPKHFSVRLTFVCLYGITCHTIPKMISIETFCAYSRCRSVCDRPCRVRFVSRVCVRWLLFIDLFGVRKIEVTDASNTLRLIASYGIIRS